LSPDGRKLAYAAAGADGQSRLWIRNIDSLEARPLVGTEGAASPFWSQDSRFIAFGDGNKVKRIDVQGGPVQTVADLQAPAGVGFWAADGTMLIGNRGAGPGMWRVSPAGGTSSPITKVDASRQERAHGFPVLLPDGRHFLYTRLAANAENAGVFLGSLDAQPDAQGSKRILAVQSSSMYIPPAGRDPGAPGGFSKTHPLHQPSMRSADPMANWLRPNKSHPGGVRSASANGTLAYRLGGVDANNRQLTWYDRVGALEWWTAVDFGASRYSPRRGRWTSPELTSTGSSDIWVRIWREYRLPFNLVPSNGNPAGSDGGKIAFGSNCGTSVYQKAANGGAR
jgi:hypothetical protein